MTDPKLIAALAALVDCIKSVLDSESPGRFAVAARMCENAHSLARETATRAGEFDDEDDIGGVGPYMNPRRRGRRFLNPIMGEGDIMREAVATAMPLLERHGAAQQAQAEAAEAATLATLLDLRDTVPAEHAPAVDERVGALLEKITERNKNNAVVSADVLRGHPTGEHGQGVPADPGAADAAGAGGGEGAAQEGATGRPGQEVVGYGG